MALALRRLSLPAALAALVWLPAPAHGGTGWVTVTGRVTDANGPVAAATVELITAQEDASAITGSDGRYQLNVRAGDYSLAATPAVGSPDGFYLRDSVQVADTGSMTLDVTLPTGARDPGSLAGTATYPGGQPAAGIEISIRPARGAVGLTDHRGIDTWTDDQGRWSAPQLAAGAYAVRATVQDAQGSRSTQATRYVALDGGQAKTTDVPLSGPVGIGFGFVTGRVSSAGMPAALTRITVTPQDGSAPQGDYADLQGHFDLSLPAGSYTIGLGPNNGADAEPLSESLTVTAGVTTAFDRPLLPLAIPPGARARTSQEAVAALNRERARWGLPAQVTANAVWSDACAAHNAYLDRNDLLEHDESPSLPGFSPGGNWAGTSAVLASGGRWEEGRNPWEDAPYHLAQLMAPDITQMGVDLSTGACATTWPGMLGPVAPVGTVFTYPGDGTTGFPPSENAREKGSVPGDHVGLPQGTITGRELFVYEETTPHSGSCFGNCTSMDTPPFTAVELTGPDGPVEVRTLDAGGFTPAGIIIPVKPLAADATYTATVSLAAQHGGRGAPATTHRWSFTTGPANPSGAWPSGEDEGDSTAPPPVTVVDVELKRWLRELLRASTRGMSAGRLLRRGSYERSISPLRSGTLAVTFSTRSGRRIAGGRLALANATAVLSIRVTRAGHRLLKARPPAWIKASAHFTGSAARMSLNGIYRLRK